MKEPTQQQAIEELINSFADALALVAYALAREGDTESIKASMQSLIAAAKKSQGVSQTTIEIATTALAAVDAAHKEKLSHDPGQSKH